jgi:hypothetical protein
MIHFRLRALLIVLALITVGASAFGPAMATAHRVALEDALLERLDKATVASVLDYLNDTWASRSLGYAVIAVLWATAGIAIDRLAAQLTPATLNRR